MSAVGRRGAPESYWEKKTPSQNFRRPPRLVARPRLLAHHRRPIYVSFVSKAVLWDRGGSQHTVHEHPPVHRPSCCPRFVSHMKARPEDFAPRVLTSTSRPRLPSRRTAPRTHVLAVPETQTPEGHSHVIPNHKTRKGLNIGLTASLRLPPTPPPSIINPTPPQLNNLQPDCGREKSNANPASPSTPLLLPPLLPQDKNKDPDGEMLPDASEPDSELNLGPATSSPSPRSLSCGSFSDFSRPPSSLFSRSTDLFSSSSSNCTGSCDETTGDIVEIGSCSPRPSSGTNLPPISELPPRPNLHKSSLNTHINPSPLPDQHFGRTQPVLPDLTPDSHIHADEALRSTKSPKHLEMVSSVHPDSNISDSEAERGATRAFPSTTWSSCPTPQRASRLSGSGAALTQSPPVSRLESHRWSVLPPISPVRGCSAASRCSELSCTQSQVFDELEAIAPPSISGLSVNEAADSSGRPSPDTDLSPGLAALTVGCDSGNLGSLSRVQLLLLDRTAPEYLLNPSGLEEEEEEEEEVSLMQDWSDPGRTPSGDLRPFTAGSISERCDSTGGVTENKSEESGSPSSWIVDQSPSFDMFRSSPCKSNASSQREDGGPTKEESNYSGRRDEDEVSLGGRRPETLEHKTQVRERRMEERTTKMMNVLSKLRDETPPRSKSSKGRCNFEDFDFLAKYCIFSQEKLAEYKRAFEAEDVDDDGYISCLQVLLALKSIIPPELLSEEEEIYVYRILEMVDFRVTDGLVDLRLFAVIASLAQKIASMDDFMRSLITSMDFRSLEVRLFKAKLLFLYLLEETRGDAGLQRGFISGEQLLLELKAGGIRLEQEAAVQQELQRIPPLDLLDFLAYLPLFMRIHKSVISNPFSDSCDL